MSEDNRDILFKGLFGACMLAMGFALAEPRGVADGAGTVAVNVGAGVLTTAESSRPLLCDCPTMAWFPVW